MDSSHLKKLQEDVKYATSLETAEKERLNGAKETLRIQKLNRDCNKTTIQLLVDIVTTRENSYNEMLGLVTKAKGEIEAYNKRVIKLGEYYNEKLVEYKKMKNNLKYDADVMSSLKLAFEEVLKLKNDYYNTAVSSNGDIRAFRDDIFKHYNDFIEILLCEPIDDKNLIFNGTKCTRNDLENLLSALTASVRGDWNHPCGRISIITDICNFLHEPKWKLVVDEFNEVYDGRVFRDSCIPYCEGALTKDNPLYHDYHKDVCYACRTDNEKCEYDCDHCPESCDKSEESFLIGST